MTVVYVRIVWRNNYHYEMIIRTSSSVIQEWLTRLEAPPVSVAAHPDDVATESGVSATTDGLDIAQVDFFEPGAERSSQSTGYGVHVFAPTTLRGVLEMVLELGRMLHRVDRAIKVIGEGERRLELARRRRVSEGRAMLPALALTSIEPICGVGWWIPEMLEHAGMKPVGAVKGMPPRRLSTEEVLQLDPEVMLVIVDDGAVHRMRDEWEGRAPGDPWRHLRAVRDRRVYFLDGRRHFLQPGPGVFDTVLRVDELIRKSAPG